MAVRTRDADETKKKKLARLRFGNLIRSVVINRIWLMDADDQKLSLNVKRNISLLVRTQRKIGLLTMAEKSIIRMHPSLRTVKERKILVSLLAGLNCFSMFPPKLRARLAKCIKFMVIGPGRKLIKEGDIPLMVYFILSGEVEVSKNVFDHLQNRWVNRIERICGAGDCLGDVEFIETSKRRHTYTTTNLVEVLVVFDEDFEELLRPVMEKQWEEKKSAIMALDYFKLFTAEQIRTACKLCILRQFEPLETIYYEDKGQLSYVHFVISGECMILQCLKMEVRQKRGVRSFELTDITKEDQSSLFEEMSGIELLKIMRDETNSAKKHEYNVNEIIASVESESAEGSTRSRHFKQLDIKHLETRCGLVQSSDNITDEFERIEEIGWAERESCSRESLDDDGVEIEENSNVISTNNFSNKIKEGTHIKYEVDKKKITLDKSNIIPETHSSKRPSGKIENHFIDVGSLTFGGIFGLGEKFEHRVIMARTTVQCVMIPRFWLFEKDQNTGNIWQRRRFYLDITIPSRKTLFEDFLNTRQWHKFKTNVIQEHLNPDSIANPTRVQDIPIICRIVEASDE